MIPPYTTFPNYPPYPYLPNQHWYTAPIVPPYVVTCGDTVSSVVTTTSGANIIKEK